ncbi:uncharacterized protein DUF4397 [Natranaerovirga pectinivora]|uniref:Uncharacterized protein DUF4397 n=1 Tax=Natranaerovirga pectinivora TaxID=682400 RepID=A0A4R3MGA6_9FIRM|nr:DUF4397 domain-containing protein [Natranaerovirga pectinivora]TCT12113.1 uncharacterized protein DUF4397 [Natranaerovirga pectinivora]
MWIPPKEDSIHSAPSYYITQQQVRGYITLGPQPPTSLIVRPISRVSAHIRFANFSQLAPIINIYLDNRLIANNLRYKQQTMYLSLEPRAYTLSINLSNEPDTLFYETTIVIPDEAVISTVSVNLLEGLKIIDISDDAEITSDKVSIKFVNVSPDSPPLSFLINAQEKFNNINANESTDYIQITTASNFNIEIKRTDTGEIISTVPNVLLLTGNAYTFYAIGLFYGTPSFEVVSSLDGSSYFLD